MVQHPIWQTWDMEYHWDIPWPVTFSLLCQWHFLIKTDWTFLQYADNNTLYSQKRTKECRKSTIIYIYTLIKLNAFVVVQSDNWKPQLVQSKNYKPQLNYKSFVKTMQWINRVLHIYILNLYLYIIFLVEDKFTLLLNRLIPFELYAWKSKLYLCWNTVSF